MAGRKGEAILALRRAVEHPAFREHEAMLEDPGFAALGDDPAWTALLLVAEQKSRLEPAMGASVDVGFMRNHLPQYPPGMRKPIVDRTVVMIVDVAPDDKPVNVQIERSSGDAVLDQMAVEAAKGWKYSAGTSNGIKFGAPVRIPLTFPAHRRGML